VSADFDDGTERQGRDWRRYLVPGLIALGALVLLGACIGIGARVLASRNNQPTATTAAGTSPTRTGAVIVVTRSPTLAGGPVPTLGGNPSPPATVPVSTGPPPAPPTPTTAPARAFVVSGTDGDGVRLRASPGGDQLGSYAEGTTLEQIGPDQAVNGVTWRNVRGPDGLEGWVAAEFTAPAP
jgi:hypothetical protein